MRGLGRIVTGGGGWTLSSSFTPSLARFSHRTAENSKKNQKNKKKKDGKEGNSGAGKGLSSHFNSSGKTFLPSFRCPPHTPPDNSLSSRGTRKRHPAAGVSRVRGSRETPRSVLRAAARWTRTRTAGCTRVSRLQLRRRPQISEYRGKRRRSQNRR